MVLLHDGHGDGWFAHGGVFRPPHLGYRLQLGVEVQALECMSTGIIKTQRNLEQDAYTITLLSHHCYLIIPSLLSQDNYLHLQ